MFGLIDHVGVAVEDLDAALALYEGTLRDAGRPPRDGRGAGRRGGPARRRRRATSSCCSPLGPDTPVGKFLERKGPGLHHVAYRVEDIDAALDQLARARASS